MHLVASSQMCIFARILPHFQKCRQRNNRLPWICQRQVAAVDDKLGKWGDEFADERSGTSAGAWWRGQGLGGGCLQPRATTPPPTTTQPPNPPPRDPPVEQSPPSSAHLITLLPIEKEEKIKRELTLQSFKMNEMAEWDFLSFDFSVISWSNSFNPF